MLHLTKATRPSCFDDLRKAIASRMESGASMNKPIRHIAGPYEDGVQQCTRCLKIIADTREIVQEVKPGGIVFYGYREGPIYSVGAEWHDCIMIIKKPYPEYEIPDCVPMGEGL